MKGPQLSFPKEKIRVLLLEGIHESAVDVFKRHGYTNIERLPHALTGDELKAALADVHILGSRSRTQLTADVLESAPHLMAIGLFIIGTNMVDLPAAQKAGIPVFNAPFSSTRSVAELVIGNTIHLMRRLSERNILAHQGKWQKSAADSHEVRGKTLGIIGYGRIGTQVGILAEALGMEVIYYDPIKQLSLGNAKPATDMKEVLKKADVVTLHVPETADTKQMITAKELSLMKPGAKLINSSRGTVVDIPAVAAALNSGRLGGAAFDVFPKEPASNDEEFKSELREFNNVILSPHLGASTVEAQENIGREVAGKLITYSDNGSTSMSVNFPSVNLPPQKGRHRLLHIHRNQPGVLSGLNEFLAGKGANVAAQYLQTDAEIGYVVIDLDSKHEEISRRELHDIPGTIRARLLY